MRIGIVCPNFPPATFEGGISHYSKILALHLNERQHTVFGINSSEFNPKNVESSIHPDIKTIRLKGPWNWYTVRKIKQISTKLKLDCIILQFSPALYKKSFRITWALTTFKCQKITSFHTLWGKGFDRFYGILFLMGSNKIIATNSEIISILERRLPFLLKKTYWIPIGSNILPDNNLNHNRKNEIPTISYFGMLYPGKGLDLILDVLTVLKNRGHKFCFKFIGGAFLDLEYYQNEFKKQIFSLGLNDCVEYLGRIKSREVSSWLYRSRFIFLPYEMGLSDRRGSFMAAITHQKPVLTAPPVVQMQHLKNGTNALWPKQYTVNAYVKLAEDLLKNDHLISKLENGAYKLSLLFNWNKIANEYEWALSE